PGVRGDQENQTLYKSYSWYKEFDEFKIDLPQRKQFVSKQGWYWLSAKTEGTLIIYDAQDKPIFTGYRIQFTEETFKERVMDTFFGVHLISEELRDFVAHGFQTLEQRAFENQLELQKQQFDKEMDLQIQQFDLQKE
ncbi:MAG: hypothetical protein AAGA83_09015, partial [Cyanobacteria bacterium P01_F01_bin.116]